MLTTIQNRVRYSAKSSQAIGEQASRQRQAYNQAVEYTLAHPNVTRNGLQAVLTRWRQEDKEKWTGTTAVQRPRLYRGRDSVRKFHRADAPVLRECLKELKQRAKTSKKTARPPRHGNNPRRDPDSRRLFRSRKAPTGLSIQEAESIKVISARTLKVGSMTLKLAWPIPEDTNVRTVNIQERDSSIRKGRTAASPTGATRLTWSWKSRTRNPSRSPPRPLDWTAGWSIRWPTPTAGSTT